MKRLMYFIALIIPFTFFSFSTFSQCDINAGCASTPILTIDPPTFDVATSTIILDNISFGEFECTATFYQSGIVVYIYQLLPNGNRMELCNVVNPAPYNIVGSAAFGFGQTSFCGSGTINIGTIPIGPGEGFEACDGALLEVEAVLFVTDNMMFDSALASVYSELSANEFISIDLGTIEIDINNEFPANGAPLTSAIINEFATGSNGPITANCGEDVDLYVEGLSRLANCLPYDDISTGIASELSNELYYTVNGGAPVFVANTATGAAGGQLTGPDPALGGNCYAGILTTSDNPYTFEWANLDPNLCDGSTVVVTITTTDIFTGVTLSDEITINYTGAACQSCGVQGCTDMTACNFNPAATEDDGSCIPQPTCNTDPCAGDVEIVNPNDACVCIVDTPQVLGCTDATACNYNASANCDDGNCLSVPTCNIDPCMGDIEIIDPNDACACIVDTPQVLGCTDATACNYSATANCDDGSCDAGNAACADPCNPVMGCTDATACNFDAAACVDDGSCAAPPCNPGCTDPCAPNYDITADEDDGSCMPYDDTCNTDCAAGPFGGTWDATTCACINETTPVNGCTDVAFCEYNPAANCDDGSSCVTLNQDPGCNDGDCTNGLESWDSTTCSCITSPPTGINGCTDAAFCEYDPNADCDDGSCITVLPVAATIAGGPFSFCVGDGIPDFVSGITVTGGTGANTAWVITDDALNILGLPGMPGEVDFDGAGFGTCLIWYLTFEDITGAEVGMNAANLSGCFALSNSIEVIREDCTDPCTASAATIAGGPFQFCVGDGSPDFVSGITVSGGSGANSAWVITDDQLNILGLPGMPGEVDFDGAGFGTCLIWYVTFDDIAGAEVGMNAADLTGCFALSNSIEVLREDCGPCEEEITGAITVPDEGCDVSGITISIIAPDNTIINVVTAADGTFSVPGGPFPCGTYTAAFFDPSEVPACYAETGSTEPINFELDGNDEGNNDFEFVSNPAIPTLSQWGLIVLALLLMSIGGIQLFASNGRFAVRI